MTRVTTFPVAVVVCLAGFSAQAAAQTPSRITAVTQIAAAHGELEGVVTDDRGEPLAGVVVSALGSTTAFAVTDRAGRFAFRTLPPGPYLVRAHLQGYIPPRARVINVGTLARTTSSIALARRPASDAPPHILAAGVAAPEEAVPPQRADDGASAADGSGHDHGEASWRLRHLKRSVLRDVETGIVAFTDDDSFLEDSFETIGRAMGQSARIASSVIADLKPFSGEVNLLTTRSFDTPQDLFAVEGMPRGVAFVSLTAPTGAGDWRIRGAMTQGDLASWVVAGSYVRRAPATHQYEAGLLYSMQRYDGGNPAALVAVADGSRNAGEVFAYDRWTLKPGLTLNYGARYARYDYLQDDALFSPRIGLTLAPNPVLRLRVSASRRELAPGAEEFVPQALGVWLPPERTFTPLSRRGFSSERVEHYEVAAEQAMGAGVVITARAFRQSVNNQMVTLFGLSARSSDVGHYYVASAGDFEARGWGVGVSRELTGYVHGSLEYTRSDAEWPGGGPDAALLAVLAPSSERSERDKIHDLTTALQAHVPLTSTRVYLLYKLNGGFAALETPERAGRIDARFDVQINQALPFMNFTAAQWEMLLTVRNLFREDFLDASMYDELLVLKPPKRIVGGLTVRF